MSVLSRFTRPHSDGVVFPDLERTTIQALLAMPNVFRETRRLHPEQTVRYALYQAVQAVVGRRRHYGMNRSVHQVGELRDASDDQTLGDEEPMRYPGDSDFVYWMRCNSPAYKGLNEDGDSRDAYYEGYNDGIDAYFAALRDAEPTKPKPNHTSVLTNEMYE